MDYDMSIDSNYLVIEDFMGDPIEWEIQRAMRYLAPAEEYNIIPSKMNNTEKDHRIKV